MAPAATAPPPSASLRFWGLLSVTVIVSGPSSASSSVWVSKLIVCTVGLTPPAPAGNDSVPLVSPAKSSPGVATPLPVPVTAQSTVASPSPAGRPEGRSSTTSKVIVAPSATPATPAPVPTDTTGAGSSSSITMRARPSVTPAAW